MSSKLMLLVFSVLFAGMVLCSPADEPKATKEKKSATVAKRSEPATRIDFSKDLDLPFDSLATLGSRIEEARRGTDPVALAGIARFLAASEYASGKKASLTAEALMKEAVEMGRERSQSAELKALSSLMKDEATSKDLDAEAAKAEKREAEAREAFKSGEKPRGIWGYLTVRNNTPYRIYVSEDSSVQGWVNPYRDYTFTRPIRHGANFNSVLRGRTADGSMSWGPTIIDSAVNNYTWTLDSN